MSRSVAPLRIAVLCEFGSVNGGERSMLAALARLRAAVQPVFLAPGAGRLANELRGAGCKQVVFDVRDAAGRRRDEAAVQSELGQLITHLQPDLLHANSLSMGRLTGRIAARASVPCTAHLRDIVGLNRTAVADLNGNGGLFAVSAATREFHVEQGLDGNRVQVLHNGVDGNAFRPARTSAERALLRSLLQLPADARIAMTIGQIGLRKGLDVLAAAVPRIAAAHPELHFAIVGERYSVKPEAIAFEASLSQAFHAAGLTPRVHWLGYRADVAALLRGADLLIHPARQEPFGRVLLEAAATGLAIVATRVGGTAELLIDGESARLVPPGDPTALATAADEVLGHDELRQRLGAAARQRVSDQFSIASSAEHLLQAWRDVLTESDGACGLF